MDIGQISNTTKTGAQAQSSSVITSNNQQTKTVQSAVPAQTATAVQQASSTTANGQIEQALSEINKALQAMSADIEFSIDSDSNRTIVKVVNPQTQELIRQIPTKEALAISKSLERVQGLLFHQKA